jgi:hypothetical protein
MKKQLCETRLILLDTEYQSNIMLFLESHLFYPIFCTGSSGGRHEKDISDLRNRCIGFYNSDSTGT